MDFSGKEWAGGLPIRKRSIYMVKSHYVKLVEKLIIQYVFEQRGLSNFNEKLEVRPVQEHKVICMRKCLWATSAVPCK